MRLTEGGIKRYIGGLGKEGAKAVIDWHFGEGGKIVNWRLREVEGVKRYIGGLEKGGGVKCRYICGLGKEGEE